MAMTSAFSDDIYHDPNEWSRMYEGPEPVLALADGEALDPMSCMLDMYMLVQKRRLKNRAREQAREAWGSTLVLAPDEPITYSTDYYSSTVTVMGSTAVRTGDLVMTNGTSTSTSMITAIPWDDTG